MDSGGHGDDSPQPARFSQAKKASDSPNSSSRVGQFFSSLSSAASSAVINSFSPRDKSPSRPEGGDDPLLQSAASAFSDGMGVNITASTPSIAEKNNPPLIINNSSPHPPSSSIPFCDWSFEKCYMVGAPLVKCQQCQCNKYQHHVCSIEWSKANNLPEGDISAYCREHHPQYCHKFVADLNAKNLLTSPPDSAFVMQRLLPGSQESRMSIGTPEENERAKTVVATSARAQKPKRIVCRKGVRVAVKRKHLKLSLTVPSPAWDCIAHLPDDALLYGTCNSNNL